MPSIVVRHGYYGCPTHCCGHMIEIGGQFKGFEFAHPGYFDSITNSYQDESPREFAQRMIKGYEGDLDWESCEISED